MTRRTFLKLVALFTLSSFLLNGFTFANLNTPKFIKYIIENGNDYDVVFSDGSKLSVNETGLYILGRLREGANLSDVVSELSVMSNRDRSSISDDVEVFVNNLKVLNII